MRTWSRQWPTHADGQLNPAPVPTSARDRQNLTVKHCGLGGGCATFHSRAGSPHNGGSLLQGRGPFRAMTPSRTQPSHG